MAQVNSGKLCKICGTSEGKYVCPRCNILYCSVDCYRCAEHSGCSEAFYRNCVQEEMLTCEDEESSASMMQILQRVHEQQQQEEEKLDESGDLPDSGPDSDDECEAEDLASRLAGVNLDDADTVWDKLTQEEKQHFHMLLSSDDATALIPPWEPWWTYKIPEKPLIIELGEGDNETVDLSFMDQCPALKEDIPALPDPTKASEAIRYGVENAVYSYALMTRYYAGDYLGELREEAMQTLLQLSASLSRGQNFIDNENAIASVNLEATQVLGLTEENLLLGNKDLQDIIEGPSEEFSSFYLIAALSDALKLLSTASAKSVSGSPKGEFSRKFMQPSQVIKKWSKKQITLASKKLEFYIAWAKCQ